MRRALGFLSLILVSASACGGRSNHSAPPSAIEAGAATPDPDYPVTRWIPAQPSYALATRSLLDAQRSLADAIGALGIPLDLDPAQLGRLAEATIGVDLLSPDAVASIGVDARGGSAVFSEGASPTVVVKLGSPDQFQAFVQRQRQRGLVTTSVQLERTELVTARLGDGLDLQWAIADGWLWLHLDVRAAHEDPTAWFAHSHGPHAAAWSQRWQWAKGTAAAGSTLVGMADPHGAIAAIAQRAPQLVACANLAAPVEQVALSIATDGHRMSGRIALDLGSHAAAVGAATNPVPAGWPSVAGSAALAVQANVDLGQLFELAARCGVSNPLAELNVKSARLALISIDTSGRSGKGVAWFDVSRPDFFAKQLDEIPMRSALEKKRQFGPYAGHALSIPFGPSVEYFLSSAAVAVAMGDGLLAQAAGTGATVAGPLFAIDVRPPAMSRAQWATALGLAGIPHAERVADRLLAWQEGHLALAIEGNSLVFSASGQRR